MICTKVPLFQSSPREVANLPETLPHLVQPLDHPLSILYDDINTIIAQPIDNMPVNLATRDTEDTMTFGVSTFADHNTIFLAVRDSKFTNNAHIYFIAGSTVYMRFFYVNLRLFDTRQI